MINKSGRHEDPFMVRPPEFPVYLGHPVLHFWGSFPSELTAVSFQATQSLEFQHKISLVLFLPKVRQTKGSSPIKVWMPLTVNNLSPKVETSLLFASLVSDFPDAFCSLFPQVVTHTVCLSLLSTWDLSTAFAVKEKVNDQLLALWSSLRLFSFFYEELSQKYLT